MTDEEAAEEDRIGKSGNQETAIFKTPFVSSCIPNSSFSHSAFRAPHSAFRNSDVRGCHGWARIATEGAEITEGLFLDSKSQKETKEAKWAAAFISRPGAIFSFPSLASVNRFDSKTGKQDDHGSHGCHGWACFGSKGWDSE